jgi:hypothetical protein
LIALGAINLNRGVDAMTDTTVVRGDDGDDPDPIDLDRLTASLNDLGLSWGELDTVGDNPGR